MHAHSSRLSGRRGQRRQQIQRLMRCSALGGGVAGVFACALRWPTLLAHGSTSPLGPVGLVVTVLLLSMAIGLAVTGSFAYPLQRWFGNDGLGPKTLMFTAGLLSVPFVALGLFFWQRTLP